MIDAKVIRPMKTKTKRKKHSSTFKAKVGMEAMLGLKTVAQIAREYAVHPVQVSQCKTVIRERLPELFDRGGQAGEDSQKLVADLHQKIGELTVDLDYLKKVPATGTMNELRELVDAKEPMSIRDQCGLLGLVRSAYYYEGRPERAENLELMRRLDELHLEHPVYGSRKLAKVLEQEGRVVNRKRVVRLLRLMGIEAIHPKTKTSAPGAGHRICPYLLKGLEIKGPDEVWCADITYIPLQQGFMYLVAVMDWWSRCVLAWEISNTAGKRLLRARLGAGAGPRAAHPGHLKHGPGIAVHQRGVHRGGRIHGSGGEHGRTRAVDRQPVHRAAVAQREIRGRVLAGLSGRTGAGLRPGQVVCGLQ